MRTIAYALAAAAACLAIPGVRAEEEPQAPFKYAWATAYHVLPETHNNESGYSSLCAGLDGKVYVGTAKYGANAYLVEFDPNTEKQRIVVDTHKLCGLTAKGYAAQAKIHTRNFVGPSGKIYVGSKQGYRQEGDASEYPGGYVMTYDPQSGEAENLGMPFPGQGVIDVVADEERGLIYVVTCEEQHWMLYDAKTKQYKELGPMLTPYATTLVDSRGRANVITKESKLARYDPASGEVTVREIVAGGKKLTGRLSLVNWVVTADGGMAYMIQMSDPTLLEIDLLAEGEAVRARSHGKLIEGDGPDSRSALAFGLDGKLYAVVRVNNGTGFGGGMLHHLLRFDPETGDTEDVGVLAVKNPDFFDFGPDADGNRPPWSHGYHTLPDGTLTPLHHHLAMTVAADGTVYVTILYPFTLLRVPGVAKGED